MMMRSSTMSRLPSRILPPRRRPSRSRRGSALVLVLIMTVAVAALALSAIYLSAGGTAIGRLYERERGFRYAADAALQLGKARVQRDTLFDPPDTGFVKLLNGVQITDAQNDTIRGVLLDLYAGTTGDTTGRFGTFVTLVARAYDAGGTRHVRRLDLTAESFSRFAMFTNTWMNGLAYGNGEFIRGRAHSNQGWQSVHVPGPSYFDTVSAVTTITGTGVFHVPRQAGAAPIPFPTVARLAALPGYATTGNMNFAISATSNPASISGGLNVSGTAAATARTGTRLEFVIVDLNTDGQIAEREGFFRLYDLATGMDTSRLRADMAGSPVAATNVVLQNQCGVMARIGGRDEFFPVATINQQWVRARLLLSTNPTFTAADTAAMRKQTNAGIQRYLNRPRARCYPAGAPQLMPVERLTTAAACDTSGVVPNPAYAWGASPACTATQRYGGQDTTFTRAGFTCVISDSLTGTWAGQCVTPAPLAAAAPVRLGGWRAAPIAITVPTANWTTAPRQAVERTFLWPIAKPFNLNSRGVIYATSGPLFVSGLMRGRVTLYVNGHVDFIDDLTYDQDPTAPAALCRNFLGVMANGDLMVSDNSMNRPRIILAPAGTAGNTLFLGPNRDFFLHAVTLSLTNTVGVENWGGGPATNPAVQCPSTSTVSPKSGGCINQTGGVIEVNISPTYAGNNTGLGENRSVDPCQLTNAKPPFFPSTRRYLDNKYYELDPAAFRNDSTVRELYRRLRTG